MLTLGKRNGMFCVFTRHTCILYISYITVVTGSQHILSLYSFLPLNFRKWLTQAS